jgi:processive 1,2-diacylglycerol beta-glucosyltransferase
MMERDACILILAASSGAGHLIAARALEHEVRAQAPGARVEVLDVLTITNALFRKLYAGGYLGIVRHLPSAMGWLYDTMDRPDAWGKDATRICVQNASKRPIVRHVLQQRPALIINTHYLPGEIVAQMRRAGQLACPQVTVTTDYETHRIWVQEPAERYYTATEDGKVYLTTWGVAPERVLVTGIPVRPGFAQVIDQREARQRCGLDPHCPVVLLLCGGFGVGPIAGLLHELVRMPGAAQVVAIAGRNEVLRRRLERQAEGAPRPVRVIGFTDQVHEWMYAADVVVTKPGGLTVAESLACGLPLVIVNPIPGQETRNADYLLEHGAAIKVNHVRMLGHRVSGLLADGPRLEGLRAAAQAIARPHAARDIVADALTFVSDRPRP